MPHATKIKHLVVESNNRVGLLSDIAAALGGAGVNINSICCYCMGDKATFLIRADRHATAKKVLGKAGYQVGEEEAISHELTNKPGELGKIAGKVSKAGVDIDYLYGTAGSRTSTVVIKTRDDAKALKALRK
jgi:hypothetical protein